MVSLVLIDWLLTAGKTEALDAFFEAHESIITNSAARRLVPLLADVLHLLAPRWREH
jgi:hypothetical protein